MRLGCSGAADCAGAVLVDASALALCTLVPSIIHRRTKSWEGDAEVPYQEGGRPMQAECSIA